MEKNWFECKVKYRKTTETGLQKVVTEPYLVDALSFTEAESRINEKMKEYISEEFKVVNIKPVNFSEVVPFEGSEKWFKSKVSLVAYDEESGKERKVNIYLLVQSDNVENAYERTSEIMGDTMGEFSIPSVSETSVMDVFPYFIEQDILSE
jgi:hypothetical protein